MSDDLRQGRLEQACPCGRWEAAGYRCTGCLRRTGPADWYRNGDMERRIAVVGPARAEEEARPKRERPARKAQTPLKRDPDGGDGASGHAPASRSAVDPNRSDDGGQPRQSEALDHPTAQRLDMGSPDGSDGSGTASLPVDAHPSPSMSGTFWS